MCKGPLARLSHWGPLTALGVIKVVSFTTIYCNGQWWPPQQSLPGALNAGIFLLACALTIYNFLNSIYSGPGYLPLGWRPPDEDHCQWLQWCGACKGYKAPRSHHCKKCGRCVLKMDHHCPWINGCVGHRNHTSFTLFITFAVLGCSQATVVIASSIYYAVYRNWYLYYGTGREPIVVMNVYMFGISVFALGLAIGVVLAVGMLLVCQMRSICRNRTTIEDWIISKAEYRRKVAADKGEQLEPFIFPYNVGFWNNLGQVVNVALTPAGDGVTWPVADKCDQYTLTREQIAQKSQKKERSRPYVAVGAYSGHYLPLAHGLRVLISPPCSDEPRMALALGDVVITTRYAKHWLYGEKVNCGDAASVQKGYFPRCCVTPLVDTTLSSACLPETENAKKDL